MTKSSNAPETRGTWTARGARCISFSRPSAEASRRVSGSELGAAGSPTRREKRSMTVAGDELASEVAGSSPASPFDYLTSLFRDAGTADAGRSKVRLLPGPPVPGGNREKSLIVTTL